MIGHINMTDYFVLQLKKNKNKAKKKKTKRLCNVKCLIVKKKKKKKKVKLLIVKALKQAAFCCQIQI